MLKVKWIPICWLNGWTRVSIKSWNNRNGEKIFSTITSCQPIDLLVTTHNELFIAHCPIVSWVHNIEWKIRLQKNVRLLIRVRTAISVLLARLHGKTFHWRLGRREMGHMLIIRLVIDFPTSANELQLHFRTGSYEFLMTSRLSSPTSLLSRTSLKWAENLGIIEESCWSVSCSNAMAQKIRLRAR